MRSAMRLCLALIIGALAAILFAQLLSTIGLMSGAVEMVLWIAVATTLTWQLLGARMRQTAG